MSRTKKSKPSAQARAVETAAASEAAPAPAPAVASESAPAAAPADASTPVEAQAATNGKKGKLIRPRGKRGGIKHKKGGASNKQADVQQSAVKESRKTKTKSTETTPNSKTASQDQIDGSTAPVPPAEHAEKIAKFHTLLKQLEQAKTAEEKDTIQEGLDSLGGLAQYQAWSLTGSAKAGQTPTSKWCIEALNSVYTHDRDLPKFRVLDVGAITGTAYTKYRWVETTSIDLHPQGDSVQKYSFFDFPLPTKDDERYNMVALSLVINFVGDVRKRGEMLRHVHKYLPDKEGVSGFLFLVLPLSCLTNSRYMNQSHLRSILDSLGFEVLKQSDSSKLSRWLLKRKSLEERRAAKKEQNATDEWDGTVFKKKEINPGQARNNFAIVVDPQPE